MGSKQDTMTPKEAIEAILELPTTVLTGSRAVTFGDPDDFDVNWWSSEFMAVKSGVPGHVLMQLHEARNVASVGLAKNRDAHRCPQLVLIDDTCSWCIEMHGDRVGAVMGEAAPR